MRSTASVILLGLFVFQQGFLLRHSAQHEHHVCAEHGEFSHETHSSHSFQSENSYETQSEPDSDSEESHCQLGTAISFQAHLNLSANVLVPVALPEQTRVHFFSFVSHSTIPQHFLAPKQSPPRNLFFA